MTSVTASAEVTRRSIWSRHPLLWLVVFNLLVRVAWVCYMHPPQLADFDWYFTHATQLAAGQGYTMNNHPTAYWPIGWPLVLMVVIRLFGPHVMAGLFTNVVFSTGIVLVVYALTRAVLGPEQPARLRHWVAMAAAIGYSALPSQIEWNSVLGSEESFTLLLTASLALYVPLVRRPSGVPWFWRTALCGLLFGFASVTRPIGLLFPVFLAGYELFLNRRRVVEAVMRGLTFGVSMLVGILPVTLRNLRVLHSFVLVSTNGGVNLWQGTKINGGYFWTWNPYRNPLLKAGTNEVLEDKIGKQTAMKYILHHPFTTLHNGLIKVFDLYKVDTNAVWYTFHVVYKDNKGLLYTFDALDTVVYWAMVAALLYGLFWVVRAVARPRMANPLLTAGLVSHGGLAPALGLLFTFVLYNTLLFLFFPAWDRFRYPLMPLLAVVFGIGWHAWRTRRTQRMETAVHQQR
ncbi:MAG: hypothetical protein K6T78_10700 [Alicyclobacillus sp.]|nr:hypothetical protein [Alicyclobacillus sp.]